jgi:hypothetical protein
LFERFVLTAAAASKVGLLCVSGKSRIRRLEWFNRHGESPLIHVPPIQQAGERYHMKFSGPDSRWPRRITDSAQPPARDSVPPAVTQDELERALDEKFGWLISSFDLKHGLQVSEVEFDTIPGELLDGFRKKR